MRLKGKDSLERWEHGILRNGKRMRLQLLGSLRGINATMKVRLLGGPSWCMVSMNLEWTQLCDVCVELCGEHVTQVIGANVDGSKDADRSHV